MPSISIQCAKYGTQHPIICSLLYNANLILLDVVHAWMGTTLIASGFCNCAVTLHPPYLITDLHD